MFPIIEPSFVTSNQPELNRLVQGVEPLSTWRDSHCPHKLLDYMQANISSYYPTFYDDRSSQPSIGYTRLFQIFFLVGIANYLVRTTDPIGALEQDTRFELALSAWKADVLTANTNPADLQQKRSVGTVGLTQAQYGMQSTPRLVIGFYLKPCCIKGLAERARFELAVHCCITGFQDQLLKPLGHLSRSPTLNANRLLLTSGLRL